MSRERKRPAFTLIEMLVVIAIILTIAALGYAVFPRQADRKMTYATDRMQAWLFNSKQQAKRDQRPTGLRLIGPDATTGGLYTKLIYIQQPEDFGPTTITTTTGGVTTSTPVGSCTCTGTNTVTFQPAGFLLGSYQTGGQVQQNAQTVADVAPVAAGDYIEFYRGGPVYQIAAVDATGTIVTLSGNGPVTGNSVQTFRIIRQPRPLLGEEDLTLPNDIGIDLSGPPPGNTGFTTKSIVPSRAVSTTISVYEILFSPSGNVIGQNSGQDKVYLWLTDNTGLAQPLILTIQVRTGLIGVNPVALGTTDPYQFCKTGRSSGM